MTAVTPTRMYDGTLSTTLTALLYTVPGSTKGVVTSIRIKNKSAAAATVTLKLGATYLFSGDSVPAGELWQIELKDVLNAAETITGGSGTAASLDVKISGAEVA